MPRLSHQKIIVIDEDASLLNVIPHLFPSPVHRYCIWHIMNHFDDNMGREFMDEYYCLFKAVVYNSDTPANFEVIWEEALEISGEVGIA